MDEQEIADARRDLEAQGLDLAGEPGEPFLVVLDGLRDMRLVLDRGDAGGHGRAVDVERAADAVDRIDDVGRRHHPAEAQVGEAVDLREGAGHHHVLGGRDEFEPRLVIVAADVFRIGRVEHQHHMRRQARVQALHLVEGEVGARRVVGIGEEDDLGLLASPSRGSRPHRCAGPFPAPRRARRRPPGSRCDRRGSRAR